MPHISPTKRGQIDKAFEKTNTFDELIEYLNSLFEQTGNDSTYIAYIVYKILVRIYAQPCRRWNTRMDAIKVLESVKDEFMRLHIRPYEQDAVKRNGAVQP